MPNRGQIISFIIVLAVIVGGAWQALSRGEDLRMAKKLTQPAFVAQESQPGEPQQPEPQPQQPQQPEPFFEPPELEPAAPLGGEPRQESSGRETECLTEECQVEGLEALPTEGESALVVIDDGFGGPQEFMLEISTSTTAFKLLQEACASVGFAIESTDYEFGVLVEAINNRRNGQNGNYWFFYINGELSQVPPDKVQVYSGDKIEFKFIPR